MSCGGAIIIIMIDRTIAITPSAMSLGGIASSKRSVDNFCANSTRHGILVFLASALAGPWQLRRLHVAEHRGSSSRYEPSLAFHRDRRVDPSDCSRCSRLALHRCGRSSSELDGWGPGSRIGRQGRPWSRSPFCYREMPFVLAPDEVGNPNKLPLSLGLAREAEVPCIGQQE